MSYFDQDGKQLFRNQGYTPTTCTTPMVADIRAIADLYGLSTTTRTGDTTYGFGNTSGRAIYNANSAARDHLHHRRQWRHRHAQLFGIRANQLINLNPETFSNVGSGVGNVSIGLGTVIDARRQMAMTRSSAIRPTMRWPAVPASTF